MAKKRKGIGLNGLTFTQRSIAVDKLGIPWLIDPEKGTVGPVFVKTDDEPAPKQSAVKKRK